MYKIVLDPVTKNVACIQTNNGTVAIPIDPANTDYQAYLKWLEEGNTPEPADE